MARIKPSRLFGLLPKPTGAISYGYRDTWTDTQENCKVFRRTEFIPLYSLFQTNGMNFVLLRTLSRRAF